MKPIVVTAMILSVALVAAADEKKAGVLIQAAQAKEMLQGDLKAAIALYAQAVKEAGANRGLAANSLLRMAECFQKMGDAEARKIYQQVVREYADQKEAAQVASARLGGAAVHASERLSFRQAWILPQSANFLGAISSDGRYMPYVDWTDHGNLFVHDFISDTNRRLTDTANDSLPGPKVWQAADGDASFSRDGKQLVYSYGRGDRYELRLIEMKGDGIPQSRLLFDNPDVHWIAPRDWSPDGKSIAVTIQRADNSGQIGLISVADGALRVLKSIDWRLTNVLVFSPDGKYLGYDLPQADSTSERDVFVLAVDGSREVHAIEHRSNDLMMGWSPDGRRLLFASDRSGSMDLWSVPFSGGKTSGEPEVIKTDIGAARSAGISRSGAMYMWLPTGAAQPSKIQMASFDLNAGKILSAPTDVGQEYFESDRLPTWSPDGKYLAYLSERGRAGSSNEVMIIQSVEDPREFRQLRVKLNEISANVWGQTWVPGGQSMLLQGRDSKGRWGVYQMDTRTGDVTLLVSDQKREIWYPIWARDGKSLYFSRRLSGGKEWVLILRELASGHEEELMRRPLVVGDALSPDGRYLAPSSVDAASGSRLKLLLPTDGGEPRELMRVPAEVGPADLVKYNKGVAVLGAQWAPDGRSFLTMKRFNGENPRAEMWRVPIDGGSPVKLDLTLDAKHGFRLSPDGQRIVLSDFGQRTPRGEEIWALDNFLPTLSAKK